MLIRTRLLFLSLSVLAPAFLAGVLAVVFVYTEQKAAQEKTALAAANSFAALVDKNFAAIEGKLTSLAKSPQLHHGDMQQFALHAQSLVSNEDEVIVLSTVDGQQLLNTRRPVGAALPRINPALLHARRNRPQDTVVSDLFIGAIAKKQDVAVDVPVFISGTLTYRLSMGIAAAQLQPLILDQKFPTGWIATIVDTKGVVVARHERAAEFVGKLSTPDLLTRILAREPFGINYGRSLDGRAVTAFFHRSPVSGWTTIIAVPQSEIREPAVHAAALLAGILCVLMGLAVSVSYYVARKTAAPIEYLRATAERVGAGEVISYFPTGLAEADLVAKALVEASTSVGNNNALLEAKIAEAVSASELAQRALLQAQKLEALGRLTGGVAHDFNNILQTLSTCLQMLRRTSDPARVVAVLDTGDKAIRRASDITAQMRSFARVQDVRIETVDLAQTVETIMPLLSSSVQSNTVLCVSLDADLWTVNIDRLQFELALLNVVINARDAMALGGKIQITGRNEVFTTETSGIGPGDFVAISIIDQGTGIAPEVLSKALDPFFTTKPVNQGTGLGLPQAYGFAVQAKGTLVLDSAHGRGTTVTFYLPRAQTLIPVPLAQPLPTADLATGNGVILFVEDDPLVQESVGAALENAGFRLLRATTGEEAMRILDSDTSIEVVFSDVVMPGAIDGVALAKHVAERFPTLKVLLASGHADLAVDVNDVALIGKPYSLPSVINLLGNLCASRR